MNLAKRVTVVCRLSRIACSMAIVLIAFLASPGFAQHEPPAAPDIAASGQQANGHTAPDLHDQAAIGPQPVAPHDAFWAGSMVIIVAGMFLAAAVVGPIVRMEMQEEPVGHSDHDHSAHSGHGHGDHGHGDHGHGHSHGGH